MRKYLIALLGVLFVMGSIGTAFAIQADIPSESQAIVAKGATQVTLGGELRFRGWMLNNLSASGALVVPGAVPTDTNTASWYDSRVRLSIQADVSKNTTGFVQLESDNSLANGSTVKDTNIWGDSGSNNGGAGAGTLNAKPNTGLTILQAWIQHTGSGLFGVPAGIKVGHMPLALGQRQFLDHTKFGDDAIVFFMDPTKELHTALLTTRFVEGDTAHNGIKGGDINGYVALLTYKLDNSNTAGINYSYVSSTGAAAGNEGLSFQDLGLHANGKVSGVTYEAEFDTQFGKTNKGVAGAEQSFRGYGIYANAAYTFAPVTARLGFALGSGDNDTTDTKNKEFQTTMGNDMHYTFIYEYLMHSAAGNNGLGSGQAVDAAHSTSNGRATGIANTTYYRLGFDYSPMKNLITSLDGFILRATKTPSGVSKSVGDEIDLKAAYQIDTNLVYSVTAGWFNTGKFYEDSGLVAAGQKKDVTAVMHALTLSF